MDYRLVDILDLPELQQMLDSLFRASGIPLGIIDADGEMLVSTGWQKICSEYHLKHPQLSQRCFLGRLGKSPEHPTKAASKEPFEFVCASGLIDIGLPLYFEDHYLGVLFLGQFLYEPPDSDTFREQALRFGFEPEHYLELVAEVPVIPREKVQEYLSFHSSLVRLLSMTGLRKLREEQATQSLRESEQTFRSLFESSNDGIIITSLDGRILEVNSAICELLGYTHDEMIDHTFTELVETSAREQIPMLTRQVIKTGNILFETLISRKDHSMVPVEVNGRLFLCRGKKTLLGNVRDLTERKHAEKALMRSESRFRSIFESAGAGMATTGPGGRFEQVNPALCDFLGYSEAELLNLKVTDVTAPEDREETLRLMAEARTGPRKIFNLEKRYLRKDGSRIWGRVTASFLSPESDADIHAIALIQDISRRMKALEAVRKSEAALSSILAAAPMSIGMVHNRVFSWVNRRMIEDLGYDESELIGQSARILYESDDEFDRVGEIKYTDLAKGQMGEVQTRWCRKDKICNDVLLRSMPVDPENLEAGVIFTALNITEQRQYEKALRKNQILLQSVLNSTDNAMLALDADRHVIYYNDLYLDFYHFDRDWLDTHPLIDDLIRRACEMGLYPSEQADELIARRLEHLASAGGDKLIETPRLDGMLLEGYVSKLPDGGHLITFRDITSRRKAEQALRESEEQVRLLLESSGEAIYGLDIKGQCTFVNPMCLELLGYTDEQDVLGKNTHKLFHHSFESGEVYPDKDCEIYKAVRYGQSVHVAGEVFWRKNGNAFPVEYWSYPVFKDGELVGSVVNFIDITERKRAEEKLKNALTAMEQAHEQINTIVRSVADGLMVIGPNGRIILANPATEELLGLEMTDFVGEDVRAMLPDPGFLDRVSLALVGEEHLLSVDLAPWCHEDGRVRMLQARVAPVRDITEGLSGAVAILRDVTREYELNQIKDDFISTAAHELRTPMTAIIGYTEMMLDQLGQLTHAQLQEFLDIILKRSEALAHIISDMLDLSRVQSGRLIQLDKSPARIQDLVSRLVNTYSLKNRKFNIRTSPIDDLPLFCFDFDKMRQVFDNLLSNAIKFSPEGGDIDIRIDAEDEQIVIMVADQGIGMTPDQVDRVFDKFYRADASTTAVSGLGLGMSLVKSIIEGHDGRIWVESEPGSGTKVFLTLSRTAEHVE